MADNPITTPLPADLPTDWVYGQTIGPQGTDVGLSPQHGYNYLMQQVNAAQQAATKIGQAFIGLPSLGSGGKIPPEQLPEMDFDEAGSAAAVQKNLDAHTGNKNNPHAVTAAQVGADPAGSAAAVQTSLSAHTGNRNNPHSVTAQQVGADPAGSAAAVQTSLSAHTGNRNNPHSVTAQQVGADPAGSAAAVQTSLSAHTGNRSNPHSVTAQQVGADPAGTAAAVQQALASQIAALTTQMGGKVSFQTGTYKGTGDSTNILNLPVTPKVLIIMINPKSDWTESVQIPLVAIGPGYYLTETDTGTYGMDKLQITEFGATVKIKSSYDLISYNDSGDTYTWVALY